MQAGGDDQPFRRCKAEPADVVGVMIEGAFDIGEHAMQHTIIGGENDMVIAIGQRRARLVRQIGEAFEKLRHPRIAEREVQPDKALVDDQLFARRGRRQRLADPADRIELVGPDEAGNLGVDHGPDTPQRGRIGNCRRDYHAAVTAVGPATPRGRSGCRSDHSGRAAVMMNSTLYSGVASLASPVARAGVLPAGTQASRLRSWAEVGHVGQPDDGLQHAGLVGTGGGQQTIDLGQRLDGLRLDVALRRAD